MTDDEIIKALRSCRDSSDCGGCRYGKFRTRNGLCVDMLHTDAADLINRQKVEIENLKIELQAMRNAANGFKRESESWFSQWETLREKTKQYYAELYEESLNFHRAEAIKEFWGTIKSISTLDERIVSTSTGDDLVKEMTEVR